MPLKKSQKDTKALIKKFTSEKTMDILKDIVIGGSATETIEKLREKISLAGNDPQKIKEEGIGELAHKALFAYGLETHFLLSETVEKDERPFVVEFSRQLIEEYSCKTSVEKALAEVIVDSHARILRYSRKLNEGLSMPEFSKNHVLYFSMLSKALDRANRQFITALTTLVQIKSPSPEINILAKTAFVAQNQQVNINKDDTIKNHHYEIIDGK